MPTLNRGFAPITASLDTVYQCATGTVLSKNSIAIEGTAPTFEVNGASSSVNVYISNDITQPTDKNDMTIDDGGPFTTGIWKLCGQVKWILFEQATGTSTIKTVNVIRN
jgi:hypothetical protein